MGGASFADNAAAERELMMFESVRTESQATQERVLRASKACAATAPTVGTEYVSVYSTYLYRVFNSLYRTADSIQYRKVPYRVYLWGFLYTAVYIVICIDALYTDTIYESVYIMEGVLYTYMLCIKILYIASL